MLTKGVISIMLSEDGFYSKMKMCPIEYHGYRETVENVEELIEEIDVELMLKPQYSDNLLDHRNSLSKKLDKLKIERQLNTPAISG